MTYANLALSPHLWSAIAVAGLLLFAFQVDKAARELGFQVTDAVAQPSAKISVRDIAFGALAFASMFLLKRVDFVATVVLLFGCSIYLWLAAYKNKIRRLRVAGLSSSRNTLFILLLTTWVACALIAVLVFAWNARGAP